MTERRSLVIFPGALGDFVCFLPTLSILRDRSDGDLTLLCQSSLIGLARICGVDSALPIEGPVAPWLFMLEPPPEAHAFFASFSLVESFTGFGDRQVEANLARWGFPPPHRFRGVDPVHFAVHCLREVGVMTDRPPRLRIPMPHKWNSALGPRQEGTMNNARRLVVHPGSGGEAKRWSRSGFRALCDWWAQEFERPLIVLGPAEQGEAREWRSAELDIVSCEHLVDLVRMLSQAGGYLGNDSGVTHLAAVLGLPGLALFGPSDPNRWAPIGENIAVHRVEPWCGWDEEAMPRSICEIRQALTAVVRPRSP